MNSTFSGKKIKGAEIQWKDTVLDTETNKRYWAKWLDGTLVCLETHEPDIEIDKDKEYLLLGYPAGSKRAEEYTGGVQFANIQEMLDITRSLLSGRKEERKYQPMSGLLNIMREGRKLNGPMSEMLNKKYQPMKEEQLKVNRKYKCSELSHYLRGKKNIYLRIAEVKPPFDQKVMMLFESMSNGHVSVIIDQFNQARAGYPDYLYRLVQICKINKNKTK